MKLLNGAISHEKSCLFTIEIDSNNTYKGLLRKTIIVNFSKKNNKKCSCHLVVYLQSNQRMKIKKYET